MISVTRHAEILDHLHHANGIGLDETVARWYRQDVPTLLTWLDVPSIDADHIERQRAWSEATFGPGSRLNGVLDHIRKELDEIADDPTDVTEWCDVIILALDGAWRAGHEPQAIIDALKAKQAKNEAREWPDWRTMSPDQAIEHVR